MPERERRALAKAARYALVAAFLAAAPILLDYLAGTGGTVAAVATSLVAALVGYVKANRSLLEGDDD